MSALETTASPMKSSKKSPRHELKPRKLDMDDVEIDKPQYLTSSVKKRRASPMKGNEEEKLVGAIKSFIDIEMELEKDKLTLSLKADFNLFDVFRIFDRYN